jgi:RNA polymerase sigma factor (sigma-70 family)
MGDWTTSEDADLLGCARSHPDAFACFYDRYERPIVGYFMRRTSDPSVAADLAAETFAAALAAASRFRSGGGSAAAWLFAIAQNVLLKSVRKGRVEDAARQRIGVAFRLDLTDASLERIESVVASEAWVIELLDRLPAEQRQAVRAHILEDRSYAEIADEQRTTEPVIRKRVSRGLANLRRSLGRTT